MSIDTEDDQRRSAIAKAIHEAGGSAFKNEALGALLRYGTPITVAAAGAGLTALAAAMPGAIPILGPAVAGLAPTEAALTGAIISGSAAIPAGHVLENVFTSGTRVVADLTYQAAQGEIGAKVKSTSTTNTNNQNVNFSGTGPAPSTPVIKKPEEKVHS